jgi:hypothetical protein
MSGTMYEKRQEVKVVQTKYAVSFWEGLSAGAVKSALSHVPDTAVVDDCEDKDGQGDWERPIVFHEEKVAVEYCKPNSCDEE